MVTMVVMVTVAKAKNHCIDSKIGTQVTIIIREPELQKTFTFNQLFFSNLREIIKASEIFDEQI